MIYFYFFVIGAFVVTGDVLVPSDLTITPPGSCLRMNIKEEILCGGEDCSIPNLATYSIMNPTIENQKIAYKMTIKKVNRDIKMIVGAVLNIGWCKTDSSGDDWIRDGDYHTVSQFDFNPPSRGNVRIGVTVEKYVDSSSPSSDGMFTICLLQFSTSLHTNNLSFF